ncbi:DUF2272 domain-containing protein [Salipiger pacificus]|nr:DUF2272 domain-containing protein [Alloyangia pacifica]MCA0945022.1 DUF2272 domain-containing protein [Alloyangia pacifica]
MRHADMESIYALDQRELSEHSGPSDYFSHPSDYGSGRGENLAWLDLERESDKESEPPEAGSEDFDHYDEFYESEADWEEGEPGLDTNGGVGVAPSRLSTLETLLQSEAPGFAGRIFDITTFALGPVLKRGDRGSPVKILQQLLIRAGARIAQDGAFGPATEGAVSAFQRGVNIQPTGIADLATKAALALLQSGSPAGVPSTGPSRDLGQRIAEAAEAEWRIWHAGGTNLKETQAAATPHLQRYYRDGVNGTVSASQLQNAAWQSKHPWSAVFISYCMRTAGAGAAFRYSRGHYVYVAQGKRNRLQSNSASPFWAYRPTEVAPEIGDLVCASRADSGATYDNIDSGQSYATHCDIVTEIENGRIRVIGGNVRNDVGEKWLRLRADGRLDLSGSQSRFYAILRCRGAAP